MDKNKIVSACRKAWEKAGRGRLLLGVSGGADSTALLVAFSLAGVPFEVAHCNFNLRGQESLRDKEFVTALCRRYGAALHTVDFDTQSEALKGESIEMICRRLRYDFFRRLLEQEGFSRLAVGHNADDNAETFFLHALRGSGSKGLKGMDADSGEIIRPLLTFHRSEILRFLEESGESYITDSSNLLSEDYRRNFLRNEVIPLLKSRWEGLDKALGTTIELLRRENAIVEHFTSKALEGHKDLLPWEVVADFPDPATLLFRFIRSYGGTPSIASEMADSARRQIPGKRWTLGPHTEVTFTRKGVAIEKLSDPRDDKPAYSWKKLEKGMICMEEILSAPPSMAFFPFTSDRYEWRKADTNMKIKSLGMKGSQSVWKVLKDAGISSAMRKNFPVLVDCETGEPLWLPGIKRSRLHLIKECNSPVFLIYPADAVALDP